MIGLGEKEEEGDEVLPVYALTLITPFGEPNTIREAEKREDWLQWKEAMEDEINRLKAFETWDVIDKPKDVNVVSCRWVYRLKHDKEGKISKY